ncbi:MAG: calcium-binding protein [Hyphomicrobium sp.]
MIGIDILGGTLGTSTSTRVTYRQSDQPGHRVHIIGTGLTLDANGVINGGTVTSIKLYDFTVSPQVLMLDVRFTGAGLAGNTISSFVDDVLPTAIIIDSWPDYFAGFGEFVSVTSTEALFQNGDGTFTRVTGGGFIQGTFAVGIVTAIEHLDTDGTTVLNSVTGLGLTSRQASAATGINSFALYEALTDGPSIVTAYTSGFGNYPYLEGGLGNDRIEGGANIDDQQSRAVSYFNATDGVVVDLDTGAGMGRATGGGGTDVLINIDHVFGSAFNDRLTGNAATNFLFGNNGSDLLLGEGGDDVLLGEQGHDNLVGGSGNDFLIGGAGNDTFNGGAGNDFASFFYAENALTIDLRIANQPQNTGEGSDTLIGIENLEGGDFGDTLTGNNVANVLDGFDGNDTIRGLGGNDQLDGRIGFDTLTGGTGLDEFIFRFETPFLDDFGFYQNRDRILDFVSGTDTIVLTDDIDDYDGGGSALSAANFFVVGSGTQGANDFFVYDQSQGRLYYDANANGAGRGELICILNPGQAITASDITLDFILV